jgi:hypothetical protein
LVAHLTELVDAAKSCGALDPFTKFVAGEPTRERAAASPGGDCVLGEGPGE